MRKLLDSPASFRSISLTSCVSKLFERIILSRALFFLETNFILSLRQASFRPARSTLGQILFLSQSISDAFNKPKPGSRMILSPTDFCKAFDSVWYPALFHKLISAGLPPCFACWIQSFLSDRRLLAWFIKITKAVPFECVEVFRKDPFLALYFTLSLSMIYLLVCLLPSAGLFTLTTWPFGPPPPWSPLRWRPHKELCFDWSAGLEYWCLPLKSSKCECEASFFSVDPHQAHLLPNLLSLGSRHRFNPTPTFLGVTFDRTLFFSKHVSSLKAKFFPCLKALRCISASSWAPLRSPSFFCIKLFSGPFSLTPHPDGFLS